MYVAVPEKEEDPKNDKLRVNLIFEGLEILALKPNSLLSNNNLNLESAKYTEVFKLKSNKLKLTVNIEDKRLDVIVLLDQLEIEDLIDSKRHYKYLLRFGNRGSVK